MAIAKAGSMAAPQSGANAGSDRVGKTALTGGLLAGLLGSACCVGPLALVLAGVSGAWISNLTLLEPYRWVFIGVALAFMALAWRRIYRAPAAAECGPGAVCARPQANRAYRVMFWAVAVLVLLAVVFPYFAPLFY